MWDAKLIRLRFWLDFFSLTYETTEWTTTTDVVVDNAMNKPCSRVSERRYCLLCGKEISLATWRKCDKICCFLRSEKSRMRISTTDKAMTLIVWNFSSIHFSFRCDAWNEFQIKSRSFFSTSITIWWFEMFSQVIIEWNNCDWMILFRKFCWLLLTNLNLQQQNLFTIPFTNSTCLALDTQQSLKSGFKYSNTFFSHCWLIAQPSPSNNDRCWYFIEKCLPKTEANEREISLLNLIEFIIACLSRRSRLIKGKSSENVSEQGSTSGCELEMKLLPLKRPKNACR